MAKRKKDRTISVDFSEVESYVAMPEGTHIATLTRVTEEEGSNYPYLKCIFENSSGSARDNVSQSPKALWRFFKLLKAIGYEVEKEAMDIDLEAMEGCELGIVVEHEEYDGRTQAKVTDFLTAEAAQSKVEKKKYQASDVEEMTTEQLDQLIDAERFKKKLKKLGHYDKIDAILNTMSELNLLA